MLVFLTNFLEPFVWSKFFSRISCLQETLVLLRILIRSDVISFYYNNVILVCNVVQTICFFCTCLNTIHVKRNTKKMAFRKKFWEVLNTLHFLLFIFKLWSIPRARKRLFSSVAGAHEFSW